MDRRPLPRLGGGGRGPRRVVRPAGERRAHRSGEGCPKHSEGSARLKRRLRPTSARGYLGSVSVRSTDDASHRSYPALQATKGGSSRGNLPLDPVLLPFAGAKGRPPRRAVLTKPFIRLRDAAWRLETCSKNLLLPFLPEKQPPAHKETAGSRRLLIFSLITVSRYPAW